MKEYSSFPGHLSSSTDTMDTDEGREITPKMMDHA